MTLFILPLVMLTMGTGFDYLWNKDNRYVKGLLVGLVLFTLINKKGYRHIIEPLVIEDTRACMQWLQESEALIKDDLFVHHAAVPAFSFYSGHSAKPIVIEEQLILADWQTSVRSYLNERKNVSGLWLFLAHVTSEEVMEILETLKPDYEIERYCDAQNSAVYFIEKIDETVTN